MSGPVAFHDLAASKFPLRIDYIRVDNDEVVHSDAIDFPGALHVPGLGKQLGVEIRVRITYGDGTIEEAGPHE